MSHQALDPWKFLDAMLELDEEGAPDELGPWLRAMDRCPDLGLAWWNHRCLGTARTAIARATWLTWPDSDEIPLSVWASLEVLGVRVRW